MNSKIILSIILGFLLTSGIVFFLLSGDKSNAALDEFSRCLAEKKVTMYGADWCPHCQNEKKAFGSSFKFIPYIECPEDPKRCLAAGISGYPTWIFSDGRRLEGEQGVEKLSQESGCPLPERKPRL